MRFPIILLMALLVGCSQVGLSPEESANLTPSARVFQAKGEFEGALIAVKAYESQPRCTPTLVIACSDTKVVTELRKLVLEAKTALDAAEAVVRVNPSGADVENLARLSRAAIARLTQYMIAQEIKK